MRQAEGPFTVQEWIMRNRTAWTVLLVANVLAVVALGLSRSGVGTTALWALIVIPSLILAGVAIYLRFQNPIGNDVPNRLEPSLMLLITGSVHCAGALFTLKEWDSMQLLLWVLLAVCLTGAILVLLPPVGRKILGSLIILFHFGGITTAVTAVQAGAQVPWLPTQVWTHFYRPYLSFMYLNNAYHFYSPEPGPPTLIWFRIEYEGKENGKPRSYHRWVRLAERKDCLTRLQYQRLLAMTESINKPMQTTYAKVEVLAERRKRMENPRQYRLTREWWRTDEQPRQIPFYPNVGYGVQYRQPSAMALKYLSSYVAHVGKHYPCEDNPDAKIKQIRVYELIHTLIGANQLAAGHDPLDPRMYHVYFLGRYTPNGKLKSPTMTKLDRTTHPELGEYGYSYADTSGTWRTQMEPIQDMYLYWLLPIYRLPNERDQTTGKIKEGKLIDGLQMHTGDSSEELWLR